MIVAIGVQPTDRGGPDEHVRLAEVATAGEMFRALTATARHYAKVRDQHHRATARSSNGRVLASVGVNPRAAAGSTHRRCEASAASGVCGRHPPARDLALAFPHGIAAQ